MKNTPPSTFRENNLASKLSRLAGQERLVSFRGFLVSSEDDGKIRLYRDLSFNTYVELSESDIVHVVDSDKDTDPSIVYLKLGARTPGQLKVVTTVDELRRPDPTPWSTGANTETNMSSGLEVGTIGYGSSSVFGCHLEPNCRLVPLGIEKGSGNLIFGWECSGYKYGYKYVCPRS